MAFTRGDLEKIRTERQPIPVDVPEWGGTALLRVMSGTQRDAYEVSIAGSVQPAKGQPRRLNLTNVRARLVACCLVGEDGQPLYDWQDPEDVAALGSMDAAGLDRLFKACQKINGITDEDVQDLAKN